MHQNRLDQGDRVSLLYRAIDQYGQVVDVLFAEKRDLTATRRSFPTFHLSLTTRALSGPPPSLDRPRCPELNSRAVPHHQGSSAVEFGTFRAAQSTPQILERISDPGGGTPA
jgi:hypothetical protein